MGYGDGMRATATYSTCVVAQRPCCWGEPLSRMWFRWFRRFRPVDRRRRLYWQQRFVQREVP